jgi:hypothetical protein
LWLGSERFKFSSKRSGCDCIALRELWFDIRILFVECHSNRTCGADWIGALHGAGCG